MTDGAASDDGHGLIAGRYRLDEQIGSGAMGVVWRAHDLRLDRGVAVKQLLLPPALDATEAETARQRAFREGRIAARLQHPNAISVFNVAEHDGQPVLVMEYLPSRSLAALLDDRGTLPAEETARIGAQVAAALTAAHAAGVVHRDVKPGNILLGEDGTAKITDFGISRAAGDVTLTSTGLFAGTPAFLAPETARGADPDAAADVFSLGATLYAAVEGGPPYDHPGNEIAMLHAVASGHVVPPRHAGALTTTLRAMLRVEPGTRPRMADVEVLLRRVADGAPPGEEPPAAPTAPAPPAVPGATSPRAAETAGSRPPEPPPSAHGVGTGAAAAPTPGAGTTPPARDAGRSGGGPRARWVLPVAGVLLAAVVGVLAAELLVDSEGEAGAGRTKDPAGTASAAATRAGEAGAGPEPSGPPAATAPTEETTASTRNSDRTTSSTATPSSESRPEPSAPADPVQAVVEYYALLPGNTDAAWQRLGPTLRQTGRESYVEFWSGVDSVEIVGAPELVDDGVVRVELEFTLPDQDPSREVYRLYMTTRDGHALIDDDERVGASG